MFFPGRPFKNVNPLKQFAVSKQTNTTKPTVEQLKLYQPRIAFKTTEIGFFKQTSSPAKHHPPVSLLSGYYGNQHHATRKAIVLSLLLS